MTTSSMSTNYQATCARLAKVLRLFRDGALHKRLLTEQQRSTTFCRCGRRKRLTEIALDPDATRRFVAEMTVQRDRVQELLARGFMFAQESLVATGELDAVTRF